MSLTPEQIAALRQRIAESRDAIAMMFGDSKYDRSEWSAIKPHLDEITDTALLALLDALEESQKEIARLRSNMADDFNAGKRNRCSQCEGTFPVGAPGTYGSYCAECQVFLLTSRAESAESRLSEARAEIERLTAEMDKAIENEGCRIIDALIAFPLDLDANDGDGCESADPADHLRYMIASSQERAAESALTAEREKVTALVEFAVNHSTKPIQGGWSDYDIGRSETWKAVIKQLEILGLTPST